MGVRREMGHQTFLTLQALSAGSRYGFEIMQATGSHSATVYRALRSLERSGLVQSRWERVSASEELGRPRRRYYEVTRSGRQALAETLRRYQQALLASPPPNAVAGSAEAEA